MTAAPPANVLRELATKYPTDATEQLNEANTRLVLINRILSDVLGWSVEDFNPEEYVPDADSGGKKQRRWLDYHLRSGETLSLVVEAKRAGASFYLSASKKQRVVSLQALRSNHGPEVSAAITQALDYCVKVGTYAFAVTNGHQWIASIAFANTVPIEKFQCVVFYGLDDIASNLQEFIDLLSPQGLAQQTLMSRSITEAGMVPTFARSLNDVIPDSAPTRDSNYLANGLAGLMSLCFRDLTDADHENMLQRCYVSSDATNEYLARLESFVGSNLPEAMANASKLDRFPARADTIGGASGAGPGVSLVVGRAGSGKSTFLAITRKRLQQRSAAHVVLHVDLLSRTQTHAHSFDHDRMIDEVCGDLLKQAEESFPARNPYSHDLLKEIFAGEIRRLRTSMAPSLRDSVDMERRVDELIQTHVKKPASHLRCYLGYLDRSDATATVLLDNVDRGTPEFERVTFQLAQMLAQKTSASVVVSLRDTTYESGRTAGFLDVSRHNLFAISPPPFVEVARRRFAYASDRLGDDALLAKRFKRILAGVDPARVLDFAAILSEMVLSGGGGLHDCLQALAGTNVRLALDLLEDFATSPNTDLNKLFKQYQRAERRRDDIEPPLDVFLRSVMRMRSLRYHEKKSKIVNLFAVPAAMRASHLSAIRVLQLLAWRMHQPRETVEMSVASVAEHLGALGHNVSHARKVLESLGKHGLVVSPSNAEPPWKDVDLVRLGAPGRYYLDTLVFNREYLIATIDDTVIYEENVCESLVHVHKARQRPWRERFDDKARIFLLYLGRAELDETLGRSLSNSRAPWAMQIVQDIGVRYFGVSFVRTLKESYRPKRRRRGTPVPGSPA